MRLIKGFLMSLGMFSTIPVPHLWEDASMPFVIPCLPSVGGMIGGIWFGLALLATSFSAPAMLAAAVILLIPLFLSGFIHIDGLMDTCDAIFSRAELSKKRQILKDSHVGAFAVIGLCVYFLLAFSSVFSAVEAKKNLLPLLFIPIISRCLSGFTLLTASSISETGFGATFSKGTGLPHRLVPIFIMVLCMVISCFTCGPWALLGTLIGGALAALFVTHELKGISGDLCGFIITVSELCGLIVWALV